MELLNVKPGGTVRKETARFKMLISIIYNFTSGKCFQCPSQTRIGGPQQWCGGATMKEFMALAGFEPQYSIQYTLTVLSPSPA